MSTDTSTGTIDSESLAALEAEVEELREEVANLRADEADDTRKMVIIVTKGTLDMAYPPLILGSTATAFGWDVVLFHTFWGLEILHEENSKDLKLSSVGNPNMPVPNLLATVPGMDAMSTWMMKRKIDDNDTSSIEELIDICLEMGVEMHACQMTQELLGYEEKDFYDGVTAGVGAATAIDHMADADINLLI